MYILKRARKLGIEDGKNDKKYDKSKGEIKIIKKIDDEKIKSLIYDMGYYEGYNKYKYYRKNKR